jgi:hypothetical protein
MNPDFRKAALIAAGLGLLVSIFFVLRPGGDDNEAAPTTSAAATTAPATTTTTTTTESTTAPTPTDDVVTINIVVGPEGVTSARKFIVKRGRDVAVIVQSAIADEVHVHGYDLMADVAPGAPATIEFTADTAGLFEIELEEHKLPIAELEVRP